MHITQKHFRQYIGLFSAVIAYYLIHEGSHLLYAAAAGTFKAVRFMGLGMQIEVFAETMTEAQLFLFCLAGPAAALAAGWLLTLSAAKICRLPCKLIKACAYYITLTLLLLDPLYLSLLCGFVGGGDMNGITLFIPAAFARVGFAFLLAGHIFLIFRRLLPLYRSAFADQG